MPNQYFTNRQEKDTLQSEPEMQEQLLMEQRALLRIVSKVRQSLDFGEICQTTTDEVRRLLAADRVAIYRFNPDWSGNFLYESADAQWISLIESQHHSPLISKNVSECSVKLLETVNTADTYLQLSEGGEFAHGEVFRICPDIYKAGFSDCYIEVLESYQARSYAIVAIYIGPKLWGLLAAYQNSEPRVWQEASVQFLLNIAEHLGIALKQAESVQAIEQQSDELRRTLTQLKQSQLQLIQNEKMAVLGQLVAGVAHEINNPVNFIHGNLSHVQTYVEELLSLVSFYQQRYPDLEAEVEATTEGIDLEFIQTDLPKTLGSMKLGTNRIREIVLSLRNFSRIDEAEFKAVDIHEGINSTLMILGNRLHAKSDRPEIEIVKNYGNLPQVECYPGQLNQVFMHILTNAIDTLADHHQQQMESKALTRILQIKIRTSVIDRNWVEIAVSDNGLGIPDDVKANIFNPFFTTKTVGKGIGMGMSISHQIVTEGHGGKLICISTPGEGTTFSIQIPCCQQPARH
jgi:two-component system NtrC family sensor kinase